MSSCPMVLLSYDSCPMVLFSFGSFVLWFSCPMVLLSYDSLVLWFSCPCPVPMFIKDDILLAVTEVVEMEVYQMLSTRLSKEFLLLTFKIQNSADGNFSKNQKWHGLEQVIIWLSSILLSPKIVFATILRFEDEERSTW